MNNERYTPIYRIKKKSSRELSSLHEYILCFETWVLFDFFINNYKSKLALHHDQRQFYREHIENSVFF